MTDAHPGGDPLAWIAPALTELDALGLRRRPRHRSTPAGRLADGLVNLASNDYLGLAGDPRVVAAAADAARTWGAGTGGSRLITGGTALHRELERALADWKAAEDAVVFSSGYLANTATIGALVGPGDLVCSDELNHASLIDGCRQSRAAVAVYPHGDLAALDAALAAPARRRLVVTDGVFSMDGDAADLAGVCDVAGSHGAVVMVDDAHGCGVLGAKGRGTAAAQGCADRVHVAVGTLSKAFGAAGGYVTGSAQLCEWLRNRARGFVFDTAPVPAAVGAALEALRIGRTEPWRRERVVTLAARLAEGLDVPRPAAGIVPLVVGAADAAMAWSQALEAQGLLVTPIRPPTVPAGTARLRFALSAGHTDEDVERAVAAVARLRSTLAPPVAGRTASAAG